MKQSTADKGQSCSLCSFSRAAEIFENGNETFQNLYSEMTVQTDATADDTGNICYKEEPKGKEQETSSTPYNSSNGVEEFHVDTGEIYGQSLYSETTSEGTSDVFTEEPVTTPYQKNSAGKEQNSGDEPVYPGAPNTKAQSLLLLMTYVLKHNCTGQALEHLLRMFNAHFPGIVPETQYMFHKTYGEYGQYEPHFYCSSCLNYLGATKSTPSQCDICHSPFDANVSLKNGSFFLVMSLSTQIKELLENQEVTLLPKVTASDTINDIQNGALYQKLVINGEIGEDDLTLLWNCDGIPVFKSSKYQIWPIQCQIIELGPHDRKHNICVPCLWFGPKKPNMMTLLTPFVNEALVLQNEGITWVDKLNTVHVSKVHLLVCSSDSIARPLLRNTKQFNGTYGCDFCYHKGGGSYAYYLPEPAERTESEHYSSALAATPKCPVLGVKGPSPLIKLDKFQMINGFVPEYQHSVCLGVTKQLAGLWFDSCHHENQWYIGTKRKLIDKELLAIQPPVEITRTPRSVEERKYWKASEWRAFLIFYALPTMKGILPRKFWNHLFLLVFGVYILLQDKVKQCDIDLAEKALRKFVIEFQKLYGTKNVTFNVHLLMHLTQSVRNWGPLWATSTFSFESFNGVLLKFFNGTTHVPLQIVKRFMRWRSIPKRAKTCMSNGNDNVQQLFCEIQSSKKAREPARSKHLNGDVRVFGKPSAQASISVIDRIAVEHLVGLKISPRWHYSRFVVNDVLFHSAGKKMVKRNNSVVRLDNGMICAIKGLITFKVECIHGSSADCDCRQECCVVVKELKKLPRTLCRNSELQISSTFVYEVEESDNVIAIYPKTLRNKCIVVSVRENTFIIPLPNPFERD
ncbi:uncharacterized protein LOC143489348 [Brachyhypopomus gauderio]|uniref:uncharacterized protein LOC143489348 n=1 Tax=Brachyhypopomus gauderio TaxID=698409 RepID=UPI004042C6FA